MKKTLIVKYQHLLGNDPEGFNSEKWIDAIKKAAIEYFPEYKVDFRSDVQSASGYCKPMEFLTDSDEPEYFDEMCVEQSILHLVGDYSDSKFYE